MYVDNYNHQNKKGGLNMEHNKNIIDISDVQLNVFMC